MVSNQPDIVKFLLIYRYLQNAYWFKRGAYSVTRSTCRGFGIAQFVETSNAQSPTPVYVYRKHS